MCLKGYSSCFEEKLNYRGAGVEMKPRLVAQTGLWRDAGGLDYGRGSVFKK